MPEPTPVIGKARYKGRNYFVRWAGVTKRGNYAMRMVSWDGNVTFWADAIDGYHGDDGSIACWVKRYNRPITLEKLRRLAADTTRGVCCECGSHGPKGEPCPDCGGEGSFF